MSKLSKIALPLIAAGVAAGSLTACDTGDSYSTGYYDRVCRQNASYLRVNDAFCYAGSHGYSWYYLSGYVPAVGSHLTKNGKTSKPAGSINTHVAKTGVSKAQYAAAKTKAVAKVKARQKIAQAKKAKQNKVKSNYGGSKVKSGSRR